MSRIKKTPAAEQFAALGIPESDWTPAMQLAVKQRWSGLPVTEKVADLRSKLAAVQPEPIASVDDLEVAINSNGAGHPADVLRDLAIVEHARLKRNAGVNAWRARGVLQAALDARDLKFKALRAGKKSTAAPVDGDAAVSS